MRGDRRQKAPGDLARVARMPGRWPHERHEHGDQDDRRARDPDGVAADARQLRPEPRHRRPDAPPNGQLQRRLGAHACSIRGSITPYKRSTSRLTITKTEARKSAATSITV